MAREVIAGPAGLAVTELNRAMGYPTRIGNASSGTELAAVTTSA